MSNRAKVSSVEAIEGFRNSLIIYLSKARPSLEDVNTDVARTRSWIENEQRLHWEHEFKRRKHKLEDAQNALFSAELSNLREVSAAERVAVNKAKAALDEAEVKLRLVKRWNRELSSQLEPLAKQLEHLHTVFSSELPHAIAYLSKTVETLHDYTAVSGNAPKDGIETAPPPAQSIPEETNEPQ